MLAEEATADETIEKSFAAWWDDADDEVSERPCTIEGKLPAWLSGRVVRNGPGKWEAADKSRRYTHAFDGLAKLVAFELNAGSVRFSTRFLRSDWYNRTAAGAMPASVTTGPVEPAWSAAEGVLAAVTGTAFDNTPVNLHRLGGSGGRWVAVTDAPPLIEFDPVTLETRGRIDTTASPVVGETRKFGVAIPGFEAFSTAHPQRHPTTGETLNYFLELRPVGGPVGHIVASSAEIGGAIERRVVGSVEFEAVGVKGIPYVHSFAVSENYVVLALYPLTIPFERLANGEGFLRQLEWDGEEDTRLVVWDLRQRIKAPQVWRTDACWAYHVINCFEDGGGGISLDLNAYRGPEIASGDHGFAYLDNMRDRGQRGKQERDGGYLRLSFNIFGNPTPTRRASARWLELRDGEGRDWSYELVRVSEAVGGRRHRYSYGFTGFNNHRPRADGAPGFDNGFGPGGGVVKVDSDAAADGAPCVIAWSSPTAFPSEPLFVPRPGGVAEDDGVLLFLGFDLERRESFLGVLDASDMRELARAYCGSRCCVSFHGQWIPSEGE